MVNQRDLSEVIAWGRRENFVDYGQSVAAKGLEIAQSGGGFDRLANALLEIPAEHAADVEHGTRDTAGGAKSGGDINLYDPANEAYGWGEEYGGSAGSNESGGEEPGGDWWYNPENEAFGW